VNKIKSSNVKASKSNSVDIKPALIIEKGTHNKAAAMSIFLNCIGIPYYYIRLYYVPIPIEKGNIKMV